MGLTNSCDCESEHTDVPLCFQNRLWFTLRSMDSTSGECGKYSLQEIVNCFKSQFYTDGDVCAQVQTALHKAIEDSLVEQHCDGKYSLVYPARSCVAKCRNKECVIHHEKDKCKEEKSCKSQIYNCQQRRPARGCEDDQRCCCRTKEGKMLSCGKNAECADLTYLLFCENPESPCNETRNRKHSKKKKRKKSRIKKSEVDKRNMRNCEINENIRPQKCVITKTSIKCRRRISRNSQIGNTSQTCKRRRTRTPVRSECSQSRNRRKSPRSTRGSRETPSTGRRCLQEEHHYKLRSRSAM